jgi:hypothetical protein
LQTPYSGDILFFQTHGGGPCCSVAAANASLVTLGVSSAAAAMDDDNATLVELGGGSPAVKMDDDNGNG